MARSSQTEQLASYRQHIETSKKWRKDDGHDALWKRLIDLYKGKHYDHFS
jgi:hypothetical protein